MTRTVSTSRWNQTARSIYNAARGARRAYQVVAGYAPLAQSAYNMLPSIRSPQRPPFRPPTFKSPGGTQRVTKPRKRFESTARFGGYLKTRKFWKKKSVKRKYKKAFQGVMFAFERNGLVTDDKCVYLAHHTAPYVNIVKGLAYVLFKKMLQSMEIEFDAWTTNSIATLPIDTQIQLVYKPAFNAVDTAITYSVVAGDTTFGAIAEKIWDVLFRNGFLIGTINGFDSPSTLVKMNIIRVNGGVSSMNLRDATISCILKSALKMQNRSLNSTGDNEADDINNVPLTGRSYEGSGNGLKGRDNNLILPPCDNIFGWTVVGAGTEVVLQEPPQPYHFQYAYKSGAVRINPGIIKTSVLNDKLYMKLDRFLALCRGMARNDNGNFTLSYNSMGKTRLFALERSISRLTTELQPGITVATELDSKIWIDVNIKRSKYTAPVNIVF